MPEKKTVERAKAALRQGKRPTTAAGEFVREEVEHVRRGEHGARSPQQAIAIGLSKARRAGVPLPPPGKGKAKERTRRSARYAYEVGQKRRSPRAPSRKRSAAARGALKRERKSSASRSALSAQAKRAAARRRRARRA
ncbi:MAG TPA: transcription elongation factor [Anaeromyxobacter sp.]|nr:transcription elongation factor [Anaeromyxobacter sp.]